MEWTSIALGVLCGVIGTLGLTNVIQTPPDSKKDEENESEEDESEVIFFPDPSLDPNASPEARGLQYKPILGSSMPLKRLSSHLASAKTSIDICVYMITHQNLTETVVDKIRSGVKVRLIVDDANADLDESTVTKFRKKGAFVRSKPMAYLMHHKFAIIDGKKVANGSFNWTMQAAMGNKENIIVTNNKLIVSKFAQEFNSLWQEFSA